MIQLNTDVINFIKLSKKINSLAKELQKDSDNRGLSCDSYVSEKEFLEENKTYFYELKEMENEFKVLLKSILKENEEPSIS